MKSKEPLVDTGIVQIALAVAAVGFVMADSSVEKVAQQGRLVFALASLSSAGLFTIYTSEWAYSVMSRDGWYRRPAVWVVLGSHLLLGYAAGFGAITLAREVGGVRLYQMALMALMSLVVLAILAITIYRDRG